MRTTLEAEDIQAIAEAVIEKLRPLLVSNNKHSEDRVFDKKGLAEYLNVSMSTVNSL
jgi:hypothetical protein